MPEGKLSAQTGHAYDYALRTANKTHPHKVNGYHDSTTGGSKVSMYAKNENHLIKAYHKALELGIPCSIVVDSDHILPPYFDGNPIITALGIGPCTKKEVKNITKKFECI